MVTLEIGGFLGGISAGALSDRLFNGRRGPVIVFFTALLAPLIMAMANFPLPKGFEDVTLAGIYFCFGLFSFGPHVLVGLTGTFMYCLLQNSTFMNIYYLNCSSVLTMLLCVVTSVDYSSRSIPQSSVNSRKVSSFVLSSRIENKSQAVDI